MKSKKLKYIFALSITYLLLYFILSAIITILELLVVWWVGLAVIFIFATKMAFDEEPKKRCTINTKP